MSYPYTAILGYDDAVGDWVHKRLGSVWVPNAGKAIGLINDAIEIVVGWTYTNWNKTNCVVDVVAEAGGWCTPEFLYMAFDYPFNQMGVKRITSPVAESNTHCQQFVKWLGATHEATLKDACPTGDVRLYRMFKNECRWIKHEPTELPRIVKNG